MIGVDLIEIERFRNIKKTEFSRWEKIFLRQEWDYAFKDAISAAHLAGMFAAKEALIKAFGGEYSGKLNKIYICHDEKGRPFIKLLDALDNVRINTSISHNKENAIAVVSIDYGLN